MTAPSLCPVPGCGAPRNPKHAMCRACWALVPRALQSAVYDAWRRVTRLSDRQAGTAGYRMAVDGYRGARESAIQAVVSRR